MWDIMMASPPNESLDTTWQLYNVFRAVSIDPAAQNKYIGRPADSAGKSADNQKYGVYQIFAYKTNCKTKFCTTKNFLVFLIIFLSALKLKNHIFSLFSQKFLHILGISTFSCTPMELAPSEIDSPTSQDYFSYWSYLDLKRLKPSSEPMYIFPIRNSFMLINYCMKQLWIFSLLWLSDDETCANLHITHQPYFMRNYLESSRLCKCFTSLVR